MRSTIDKAGRLVIPKALRDMLGLVPGAVEVTPEGAGLHIEPLADDQRAGGEAGGGGLGRRGVGHGD